MRSWKFWDWTSYGALAVATFMTAFDSALKNSSALAKLLPGLSENALWAFTPATLVVAASAVLIFRGMHPKSSEKTDGSRSLLPPRLSTKIRYGPKSEFALLPLQFSVDLAAQYPQVEVRFHAVNFLPHPLRLTEVDLSLQLYNRPALEDLTFRQRDIQLDPKDYEVVICRRQLTDAERVALPWQSGRVSGASYQLSAKATDGESIFSFGPVSSMVIEGWINASA